MSDLFTLILLAVAGILAVLRLVLGPADHGKLTAAAVLILVFVVALSLKGVS